MMAAAAVVLARAKFASPSLRGTSDADAAAPAAAESAA